MGSIDIPGEETPVEGETQIPGTSSEADLVAEEVEIARRALDRLLAFRDRESLAVRERLGQLARAAAGVRDW